MAKVDLSAPELARLAMFLAQTYAEVRTALIQEVCKGKGWEDLGSRGLACPWCGAKVACQERKVEPETCLCCGFRTGKEKGRC